MASGFKQKHSKFSQQFIFGNQRFSIVNITIKTQ